MGRSWKPICGPTSQQGYSDAEEVRLTHLSQLAAGTLAAYAQGDVPTAISTAKTTVENNAMFVGALLRHQLVGRIVTLGGVTLTAYEIQQDLDALVSGQKTLDQIALERGREYVTGVLLGAMAQGSLKIAHQWEPVRQGEQWILRKIDDAGQPVTKKIEEFPSFSKSPRGKSGAGESTKAGHAQSETKKYSFS